MTVRPTLILAGAAIVAAVAILGAAFAYFGGKPWALNLFKRDLVTIVCRGDSRQGCGTEHWIDCDTDPVAFMKRIHPDLCVNVTAKQVSEVPGSKCSSTTFELKCSR